MSQKNPQPVPVSSDDDEISFKSCCTEVFRWLRSGAELIEEAPAYFAELARDLEQAWQDSAKK